MERLYENTTNHYETFHGTSLQEGTEHHQMILVTSLQFDHPFGAGLPVRIADDGHVDARRPAMAV